MSETRADWDMSAYFSGPGEADYVAFRDLLRDDVHAIADRIKALGPIDDRSRQEWRSCLLAFEDVTARNAHLGSYLGCLSAADSRDEIVRAEVAAAAAARAEIEKAYVVVRAALVAVDDADFAALVDDRALTPVRYFLDRLRVRGAWSMDAPLEELRADLDVDGLSAWGRLYDQVSGKLEFDLEISGRATQHHPVAITRSLLEDPDAEVRRAALVGSNAAWERVGDVTAACLNAISGIRHTVYRRQGVPQFLDPALFDARISRKTLDTILAIVAERAEIARNYLRLKARILGRERLGFQDLLAPLPLERHESIDWPSARDRVVSAFSAFHSELGNFAAMAFERRWIDHSARRGKRPGGFCSTSSVIGESRIFMTYNETLGDLSTLAHELGHAFHGWAMRDMRPWARRYPMTLAETASTFAEQLLSEAVLADPDTPQEVRASLLDARMRDAATFLLNIPMRFAFEHRLYEERAKGELGVPRLCALMLDAQRACYGDALAEDELDPWFWASKLHFYITGTSFYNFPYTFGYLFSLGIFARSAGDGEAFLPRYRALLRATGSDAAEAVAKNEMGVDLTAPAFWNESIDLIENDLSRFEQIAATLFDVA